MKTLVPPELQKAFSRREVVAGVLMASAAAVAAARRPNIKLDYLGAHKLEDVVPKRIGRWEFVTNSGLVVPPDDQLRTTLYSQLLTRTYSDGQNAIMLLMAYSADQTGFLQVHRPEFCYTAAGYHLSDFAHHTIPLAGPRAFTVNSLTAQRDATTEKLVYWARIGNHIPLSWAQQKLTFAEDNLKRQIPDAALVRVSTTGQDDPQAFALIDGFIRDMIASVPASLQRVFVA